MHNANDVKVAKRVATLYMKSKYVLSEFDVKSKDDVSKRIWWHRERVSLLESLYHS